MFEYLLVILPYWLAFEAGSCMQRCIDDTEDKKIEKIAKKVIMNVRPICSYYRDVNSYK
jgi:hypothetical protein